MARELYSSEPHMPSVLGALGLDVSSAADHGTLVGYDY